MFGDNGQKISGASQRIIRAEEVVLRVSFNTQSLPVTYMEKIHGSDGRQTLRSLPPYRGEMSI